jgi:hypothetical protein
VHAGVAADAHAVADDAGENLVVDVYSVARAQMEIVADLTTCPSARMTPSAPSHALRPTVTRPSTAEPTPTCTGGVAKLGEMPE